MTCGLHCLKLADIGVTAGGHTILEHVNLHVHCGELTAIIGRNGAGKTTLLKAILNQVPHTGTVTFSGHTPGQTVRRPVIGYVPQSLNLDAGSPATAADLALSFCTRWPAFLPHRPSTLAKLRQHFERFEAADLLPRPVGRLSGGELQRVLLAIATLPKPDLLILDEPVSGVDKAGLQRVYHILQQLKTHDDMVIIMVSHDLDYVRRAADRVVLLNKRVEAVGPPEQVFATAAFRSAFSVGGGQHV